MSTRIIYWSIFLGIGVFLFTIFSASYTSFLNVVKVSKPFETVKGTSLAKHFEIIASSRLDLIYLKDIK